MVHSPHTPGDAADSIDLAAHVTETQLVALAEAFGGTRVYLPKRIDAGHRLAKAIGFDAARALIDRIGSVAIRIPLARELRARHYRDAGESHAQIARRLGMSEVGIQRLLKRLGDAG